MESNYRAGPVTLHPTFRTNVAHVAVDVDPGAKLMATATGVVSFTRPVAFDTVKCYLYLGVNLASPNEPHDRGPGTDLIKARRLRGKSYEAVAPASFCRPGPA